MLHSFLSRLQRRRSKTPILCTSSVENRSGEKSSMGPSEEMNCCKDPTLIESLVFNIRESSSFFVGFEATNLGDFFALALG